MNTTAVETYSRSTPDADAVTLQYEVTALTSRDNSNQTIGLASHTDFATTVRDAHARANATTRAAESAQNATGYSTALDAWQNDTTTRSSESYNYNSTLQHAVNWTESWNTSLSTIGNYTSDINNGTSTLGFTVYNNTTWTVTAGYNDTFAVTQCWIDNSTNHSGSTMPTNTSYYSNGSSHEGVVSLTYSVPAMSVVAVVLFVVLVFTAVGNFLVGLAIFKFRYLRTVSNYLIGNLALSDFLLSTTILPLSTVQECLGYWVFGEILCTFWLCADVLYCTASIWNLCVIAFDRFTATLYPLWYREKRSTRQAVIYIGVVWIISLVVCVPPLLGWLDMSKNYKFDPVNNVHQCEIFQTPSYVLYSASGSFFIPFFITLFLYIRIFQVLRLRMRAMRNRERERKKKLQLASNASQNTPNCKTTLLGGASSGADSDRAIEMSKVTSSGVEDFGSKVEDNDDSDFDDDDDSCLQISSDQPLCKSEKESSTIRNGLKEKVNTVVLLNSQLQQDAEKVKIVVSADESRSAVNETNPSYNSMTTVAKEPRRSIAQGFFAQTKNPFKRKDKKGRRSSDKRKMDQREMRATIRMAIIIAFFCGMWIGFFILYVIQAWCASCHIPRGLAAFFFWLGYANSSMNPILYTIFNEEFRKAFIKILGCYGNTGRSN